MSINSSPISIVNVESNNNETTEIIVQQYEIEFDELWSTLISKENELIKKNNDIQSLYYSNQILQTNNIELTNENLLLKNQLSILKIEQKELLNEISTAQEFLLNAINNFK